MASHQYQFGYALIWSDFLEGILVVAQLVTVAQEQVNLRSLLDLPGNANSGNVVLGP